MRAPKAEGVRASRVFLKSLTLRGFKSFAEKTTLDFEPGITVIVGPNGSGKSNVVDAIAWVLGEQGPKSLRGGKMQDVIFAGTGSRGALGRAEVALTIDNSAGLLPIEYTEVTVTRLLYRSGESEYAINGTTCRLLDIQELLSDTGVGRELHTVLGQNRLEDVLEGRPEDRRAAIEEAAGVYKHRRRKEKALRKLAGMEQHLVRLSDLVGELRRQLKPLQQQAETAARAAEVAAELREVRLTLRSRELARVRERSASLDAEEAAFAARLAELEQRHDAEEATRAATSRPSWPSWSRGRPGRRGRAPAGHRARAPAGHGRPGRGPGPPPGRGPGRGARRPLGGRPGAGGGRGRRGAGPGRGRAGRHHRHGRPRPPPPANQARAALAAFDQAAARADRDRAAAHRREVRLASEVAGLERTIEQMEAEAGRLREPDGRPRGGAGPRPPPRSTGSGPSGPSWTASRRPGTPTAAPPTQQRDQLAAAARRLAAAERRVEAERAAARARREAFEATARAAGGDALAFLEGAGRDGVLGPLAPALSVTPGYEAAVAAALGPDADAIVVAGPAVATAGARLLRDASSGRAILLHPSDPPSSPRTGVPTGPPGSNGSPLLLDRVATAGFAGEVARGLLDGVLVADDLDQARELLERHPGAAGGHPGRGAAGRGAGRGRGGARGERAGRAAGGRRGRRGRGGRGRRPWSGSGPSCGPPSRSWRRPERRAADAARALRDAQAAVRRLDDRATMVGKELRDLDREAATAAERLHELDTGRERTAARLPPPGGAGRRQGRAAPGHRGAPAGRARRDRGRARRRAAGRRAASRWPTPSTRPSRPPPPPGWPARPSASGAGCWTSA